MKSGLASVGQSRASFCMRTPIGQCRVSQTFGREIILRRTLKLCYCQITVFCYYRRLNEMKTVTLTFVVKHEKLNILWEANFHALPISYTDGNSTIVPGGKLSTGFSVKSPRNTLQYKQIHWKYAKHIILMSITSANSCFWWALVPVTLFSLNGNFTD